MFVAKLFNEIELAQLYFYQNVSYKTVVLVHIFHNRKVV